jgi:hypothetical protein
MRDKGATCPAYGRHWNLTALWRLMLVHPSLLLSFNKSCISEGILPSPGNLPYCPWTVRLQVRKFNFHNFSFFLQDFLLLISAFFILWLEMIFWMSFFFYSTELSLFCGLVYGLSWQKSNVHLRICILLLLGGMFYGKHRSNCSTVLLSPLFPY